MKLVYALISLVSISDLGCAETLHTTPPKPNIVIIVADDMGWKDVGYHGGPARTPAIDRLVDEGVFLLAELAGKDAGSDVIHTGGLVSAARLDGIGCKVARRFDELWIVPDPSCWD